MNSSSKTHVIIVPVSFKPNVFLKAYVTPSSSETLSPLHFDSSQIDLKDYTIGAVTNFESIGKDYSQEYPKRLYCFLDFLEDYMRQHYFNDRLNVTIEVRDVKDFEKQETLKEDLEKALNKLSFQLSNYFNTNYVMNVFHLNSKTKQEEPKLQLKCCYAKSKEEPTSHISLKKLEVSEMSTEQILITISKLELLDLSGEKEKEQDEF